MAKKFNKAMAIKSARNRLPMAKGTHDHRPAGSMKVNRH
jgi:hypothetical protein